MDDIQPGASGARPGMALLRWFAPPVAVAAAFGFGVAAVDAVITYYDGSYVALSITAIVGAFWACAAAVAGIVLAALAAGVMRGVKSDVKYAIVPACIIAAGFALHGLAVVGRVDDRDALGRALLFNPAFLAGWGVMLGVLTAVVAARDARRSWTAYTVAWAAILVCGGTAPWAPADVCGFTLVVGPLILIAVVAAVALGMRRGYAAALVTAGFVAACAAALWLVDSRSPQRPLVAIERTLPAPAVTPQAASRPNVILIVMDALRGDHASFAGYKYPTTPDLAKFAADCRVYTRATSVDSSTLPSHAAMFTGLYPRENGAHAYTKVGTDTIERYRAGLLGLSPARETLATYLSKAGYATGAITANYARLCRQFGLDQGFEYYYDIPRLCIFTRGNLPAYRMALDAVDRLLRYDGKLVKTTWSARAVTGMGRHWIDGVAGRPFFLFLNLMDVHYPYAAPAPFQHVDGADIPYDMRLRQHVWRDLIERYNDTGKGLDDVLLRRAINQYDGGAAYADKALGEFFETLKRAGLYDNTLIIVTSDHGEFFGEHGLLDHTRLIYEEGVRVPIMVKYPGSAHAGEVKTERVSTVDVFATVLDVAGLPLPGVTAQPLGRSTHPVIVENYRGGARTNQPGGRTNYARTVMYLGDYKYMHSTADTNELYDLARDPTESTNLVAAEPEVAARMEAAVTAWLVRTPAFDGATQAAKPMPRGGKGRATDSSEDMD